MSYSFCRLVATILLGVFSVFLIPKELVHAFYGHTDTEEQSFHSEKATIGAAHIHCDFLTYEASLFTVASEKHSPWLTEQFVSFTNQETQKAGILFSNFPSLRGPPQL